MALINLKSSVITNITIECKGGTNPSGTTILLGPDEKVIIVESLLLVCTSAVADAYVYARVDSAAPATVFATAYFAYNERLRRGSPGVNLLRGRSLYLAEGQSLILGPVGSSGDFTYLASYALVDNV